MLICRPTTGTGASTPELLAELGEAATSAAAAPHPSHDQVVALLIDAGILESAVADALSDECERTLPPTVALQRVTKAVGHASVASWDHDERRCREWLSYASARATQIDLATMPERVTYRAPEGYAYYGLYPESYIEAAREVWADRRPHQVLCLGIRSIGSSLAAVVGAALEQRGCAVTSWTVRPLGHPFDRRVCISRGMAASLLAHPPDIALVIDEGPGLSGSSFAAAAGCTGGHRRRARQDRALSRMGAGRHRFRVRTRTTGLAATPEGARLVRVRVGGLGAARRGVFRRFARGFVCRGMAAPLDAGT